jgi:PAS domain S-box-containing protein
MKYKCATFVILLCLISIFFLLSNNTHEVQYGLEQDAIEKIIQLDSDIDRELLQLHKRVKNNFDDMTSMMKQKYVYLEKIETLNMNTNIAALKQSIDKNALLIEEFKSEDSVLHNSENYIPIGIDQLKYHIDKTQPNNDFTEILLMLKNEILLFTQNQNTKDSHDIDSLIKDIDSLSMYRSIKSHELWDGIKRHAASIIIHIPNVNGLLQDILSPEYRAVLNVQHQLSIEHEKAVKVRANIYKLCLFLTTLALLFYCLWVYIRINRYTKILSELNASLEHKVDERNKELHESVSRRDELINSSPSIIYAMEAFGDFKTTYISGNVEPKLGYAPAKMLEEKEFWLSRIHPDDRARVLQSFDLLLKHGYMVIEYRLLDNVHNYQWVQDSAHLIRDEKDNPQEIIGSWADVTELKQAAHDIQSQKEYSENLIQNQSNPTFVIDAKHKVLSWNKSCEELTGIKSEEILGTSDHWRGFYKEERPCLADTVIDVDSNQASEIYINYRKSALLNEGIHAENWCTVANGEERFLAIDAAPVYDHDKNLIAVVENLRDMTSQKELELELLKARDDALEGAKSKSEFLANMSHEIRTPMNGVLGMLQLLRDFDLPDECQDYINTAHNSADSLLEIINDILDFSKIEAGKLSIEMIDFDLHEIVDDVCALLSHRAKEKQIELLSYVETKIPASLRGDPTRLRQVLFNLIGNALKFTEKGEVVVRVVNEVSNSNQATIKIEVVDTGIGIPKEAQTSLFDSFTQADGSTTRRFGGTGLGLAISKQLVEMMGGVLSVNSEPGKGSSFFFSLSLEVVAQDRPNIQSKDLTGLSVLVIDDNITNRIIVCNYLHAWGMSAEQTGDVDSAYRLLEYRAQQGNHFDLVTLDMQMPGMDGLEFSRKMQTHEKLTSIPRILLTSAGQLAADVWQPVGIAACLQKPYRREQLRATIKSVLNVKTEAQHKEKQTEAEIISFEHHDSKILLVEDNRVNQKVACGLLKKMGLIPDIAGNGQIALDKIEDVQYDLVLMDCQMPVMSGYQATEAIRKKEKSTGHHLPIIAMTANAMEGDREKCIAAGMDDYLSKPVKAKALKEMLDKWSNQKKENHESEEKDMNDQSHSTSKEALLDANVLNELRDIMEDEFTEVLQLYLDESVSLMSDIHAGFSEEPDKLLRALHTLKSSSRNVGAMRLGDIAANMEALVKAEDVGSAKVHLDDLQEVFTETHALINKYTQDDVHKVAL